MGIVVRNTFIELSESGQCQPARRSRSTPPEMHSTAACHSSASALFFSAEHLESLEARAARLLPCHKLFSSDGLRTIKNSIAACPATGRSAATDASTAASSADSIPDTPFSSERSADQGDTGSAGSLFGSERQDEPSSPQLSDQGDASSAGSPFSSERQDEPSSPQLSDQGDVSSAGSPFGSERQDVPSLTLMMCNLPCRLMEKELGEVLDANGFGGKYKLVHMTRNHKGTSNLGYAFVSLVGHRVAEDFAAFFDGFKFPGGKTCSVKPARVQGRKAYRPDKRSRMKAREAAAAR